MTPFSDSVPEFDPADPVLVAAVTDEDERASAFTDAVLKKSLCSAIGKGQAQAAYVRRIIDALGDEFKGIDLLD
eukprot:5347639-Pyramimonas_sp.AAC.1